MADEPVKSDIDFDELDKAVNSLMGKVGGETMEDSDKTKILDIDTTLKADEKPKYEAFNQVAQSIGNETLVTDSEVELVEDLTKLPDEMQLPVSEKPPEVPEATPEESETPAAKPIVSRPNNGRFMDMVHPRADMRTTTPSVNRVAANPITPVVAAVEPMEALPAGEPIKIEAQQTPFLSDAKVEKRPLGGNNAVTDETSAPIEDEKPDDDNEKVPEESFAETISVNSEHEKVPDNGGGDEQRPLNATDFNKKMVTEDELVKIESAEAIADEPQTIQSVESASTQGLKDAKKSKNAKGAIYDTKDYHQPINHPPKQKSGWGTVFIILIIIILAVALAGGAYLYFGLHP